MSHQPKVQTVTYRHQCSNNHQWSPLEVHQGLFCLSLNIKIQGFGKSRPSEPRVSSLVQHDSDKCNLAQYSRNLVVLQDLDLDLGLLLLLKVFSSNSCLGSQPAWYTTAILAIFRPLCMGIQIHYLLFGRCPPPSIYFFYDNVGWLHRFWVFRIRCKKITNPTSPRVQGVAHEYSRKDF